MCRSLPLFVTRPCSPGVNGDLVQGSSRGPGRRSLVGTALLHVHQHHAATAPSDLSSLPISLHCTFAPSLHCALIPLRPYPFLPPFGALHHRPPSFLGPGAALARASSSCNFISPYNVRFWWTGIGRSIHADVA